MSQDGADGGDGAETAPSARRAIYTKLLVAAAAALLIWWALPGVPRDQTIILALGNDSSRVSRLEVEWERVGTDHVGHVTLNFPSAPAAPLSARSTTSAPAPAAPPVRMEAPPPGPGGSGGIVGAPAGASESSTPHSVVHHFRLPDGEYSFRVSARRTGVGSERTEVIRQVTLNGNTLILRLEELTR